MASDPVASLVEAANDSGCDAVSVSAYAPAFEPGFYLTDPEIAALGGSYPCDFETEGTTGGLRLLNLDALAHGQAGYAFDGRRPDRMLDGWNRDWLVIGDMEADPLIFDRASRQVLAARHGLGRWEPRPLASSVAVLIGVMTIWVRIYVKEFGANPYLEEFAPNPALPAKLRREFGAILDGGQVENALWFFDLDADA